MVRTLVSLSAVVLLATHAEGATCQGEPIPCDVSTGHSACTVSSNNPAKDTWKWGKSVLELVDPTHVSVSGVVHEDNYGGWVDVRVFGPGETEATAQLDHFNQVCAANAPCTLAYVSPSLTDIQWTRAVWVHCVSPNCSFEADVFDHVQCLTPPVHLATPVCAIVPKAGNAWALLLPVAFVVWRRRRV